MVEQWFQQLQTIWQEQNPYGIANLLAPEFIYYEAPFEAPYTEAEKLVEVWQEVKGQDIEVLEVTPLVTTDCAGTAECTIKAQIDGETYESNGVMYVELDDNGKATFFKQWWNERAVDGDQ